MTSQVGDRIKVIRKSKNLSQQEVADRIDMNRAQYSRVETNRGKPTLTTLEKISIALEVDLIEFFKDDTSFDISTYEQTLVEKVKLVNQLDEEQKKSIFSIIDIAIANKRYKDFFREQVATG